MSVPSLTPPLMAVWEWASISPGVTCLPVASISTAPAGASRSWPTATILPSRISRSASSRRPAGPDVQIVAWRTITASGWSGVPTFQEDGSQVEAEAVGLTPGPEASIAKAASASGATSDLSDPRASRRAGDRRWAAGQAGRFIAAPPEGRRLWFRSG